MVPNSPFDRDHDLSSTYDGSIYLYEVVLLQTASEAPRWQQVATGNSFCCDAWPNPVKAIKQHTDRNLPIVKNSFSPFAFFQIHNIHTGLPS